MSQHDQDAPDAEEEARVRALLTSLGSGEDAEDSRLPADVAARLEDTLTALVAERGAERLAAGHRATGSVVPVRPSWMPRIAAAAAAVVVLGAGGLVLSSWNQQRGSSSDAGGGSATSGATRPESPAQSQSTPRPGSGLDSGGGTARDLGQVPGKRQMADPSRALPQLHRATLEADARALLERRPLLRTPLAASPAPGTTDLFRGCPGPGGSDQAVTPVRYDGRTAALVVRAADADGQRVEVWTCDGERRLAATTLSR